MSPLKVPAPFHTHTETTHTLTETTHTLTHRATQTHTEALTYTDT